MGGGGVFALYLAWRRQRSTEIGLRQKERDQDLQDRVATTTETDAAERRITELYTKSAEQLGSDKAPVRLAGLYALERLAQDNPRQRQTIVNVLCAYLRMPYKLPEEGSADYEKQVQEREVRLTAQNILRDHLRPGPDPARPVETFWLDIDLSLTGATLINLELARTRVRVARFTRATFIGNAWIDDAVFESNVWFSGAKFNGRVHATGTVFGGQAWFVETAFAGSAHFVGARFGGPTSFNDATFGSDAWFTDATLAGESGFGRVEFAAETRFTRAVFTGNAVFDGVSFNSPPLADGVRFEHGVPAEFLRGGESPPREGDRPGPPRRDR